MGLLLTLYRSRKCVRTMTISESDGNPSVVEGSDTVVARIGRGSTPLLTISSAQATANGSTLTAANPTTLTLQAADIVMPPGVYDFDLLVLDDSEGDAPKAVERGVFVVLQTQ